MDSDGTDNHGDCGALCESFASLVSHVKPKQIRATHRNKFFLGVRIHLLDVRGKKIMMKMKMMTTMMMMMMMTTRKKKSL